MAWEIETVGVKPSGTFASWRYGRVLTDENGNISFQDIDGKPTINLDCTYQYNKNDRRYGPNNLITEFCNTITHTHYYIYAQDCKPFAYSQAVINSPECGYITPLPTPIDPPAIFGDAPYGSYKHINFCDKKNIPIEIRLFKRNFNGVSQPIDYVGQVPIKLSWKNNDEDKFNPIRASEVSITFVSVQNFAFQQFYTQDEREFKVEIKKAGNLKFAGFLTPSDAAEEFIAPPYDVVLRATDGIGALKKVVYPIPLGSKTDIKQSFLSILGYCLARTNLGLNIATVCNLYESKMANGLNDDPLTQATVNPLRLSEKGKIFDCYKVLETICQLFGAFLVQDNGAWFFTRHSELAQPILRRRYYNSTGFFLYADQFNNLRQAACKSNDITMLSDSPSMRLANGYKRAEVMLEFGEIPSIVYNGDFELWDGQNFSYWTRYGGINISRVERVLETASVAVPTGTYALQFNERYNSGKYLEANPIPVNLWDKISMSYNVGRTDTDVLIQPKTAYLFKFRISVGQYFLTNPGDGTDYQWLPQLVTCTNFVDNWEGDIDNYTVNFNIPPCPIAGNMIIQLFGFGKVRYTYFQNGYNPYYAYSEVSDYTPVTVDNIAVSKTTEVDAKEPTGVLSLSQQDGYYTKIPDQTKLLFGDFTKQFLTFANTVDTRRVTNDIYAIFTADGSYSKNWYEYGASSQQAPVPIAMSLARNILKAYQRPARILASTFKGNNISYLDIFNVLLPNNATFSARVFSLLSGDLNLMTDELSNANYIEIFAKPIKSLDITLPAYKDTPSPPIVQNPNTAPSAEDQIFYPQFTNSFL